MKAKLLIANHMLLFLCASMYLGTGASLVLFSFPLIYYFTSPEVYYRRPIDPLFVILAMVAVTPRAKSKSVAEDSV